MKYLAVVLLSVSAVLAGALTAHAQTATAIYSFDGTNGANPVSGLTLGPDGSFYGTTPYGGNGGSGTVFKVTPNGTFTSLVTVNGGTNGTEPFAGLTLGPDGNFYGTTQYGGASGVYNYGTVFKVTTNGMLTTVASFNGANGSNPRSGLTVGPDGNLYGTTISTVFKVTTSGILTALASFNGTNGSHAYAGLTLGPDGNFYGTTYSGGTSNAGTVFQVATNGTLTTLASFAGTNGANPLASLTLGPDGSFYGTTYNGGSQNYGTVFRVTANGTLTSLVSFNLASNGANPAGSLTLGPDGNFYGTTSGFDGTVFKMTTNGRLTTLFTFGGSNGFDPHAGLTLGPDGNFYGTAGQGGNFAPDGAVFRLDLPPEFVTAPTNQTVAVGSSATFNCRLFGTAPFAYQWLSNGVAIAGATNANLNFSPALASEIGNYQLVVTNSWGSITSQVASLSVLLGPIPRHQYSRDSAEVLSVELPVIAKLCRPRPAPTP